MAESSDVPVLFADGIENIANSKEIVKFYLIRQDPGLAEEETKTVATAQVVMSLSGFIETAIFFEQTLKRMLEKGVVSQERIDELALVVKEQS